VLNCDLVSFAFCCFFFFFFFLIFALCLFFVLDRHLVEVVETPKVNGLSIVVNAPTPTVVAPSRVAQRASTRFSNFRSPLLLKRSIDESSTTASTTAVVNVSPVQSTVLVSSSSSTVADGRSNDDILKALLSVSVRSETIECVAAPPPPVVVAPPKRARFQVPQTPQQQQQQRLLRPSAASLAWDHSRVKWPSATTCDWLSLRDAETMRAQRAGDARFAAVSQYVLSFSTLLNEELNIRLADVASMFHMHARLLGAGSSSESVTVTKCPQHGPAVLRTVRKEGKNHGKKFFACSRAQCSFFEWVRAPTTRPADAAAAVAWAPDNSALKALRDAGLRMHDSVEVIVSGAHIYLKLGGWRQSEPKASAYSRGDIWVVSEDGGLNCGKVLLFRSVFHAPAPSGLLQVAMLAVNDGAAVPRLASCFALQAMNASSELSMLDNLADLGEQHASGRAPLVPCVLAASGGDDSADVDDTRVAVPLLREDIDAIVHALCDTHQLNDEQREALSRVAFWFRAADDDVAVPPASSHILLVHGVFGAGKSKLLVVVALLIARVGEAADDDSIRVLVSSSTNVAVDRVLLLLQELGESELFLRVGSLRKIARPILCRSVHRARDDTDEGKNQEDAVRNLKEMIASERNMTSARRAALEAELAAVLSGAARARLNALASVRIVGVTCAASTFAVLSQSTFPFVLLDECSQQMEPQSLTVLSRFGARRAALVGDPKQLPAQLHQCFSRLERDAAARGLGRALFSRLAATGCDVVMLRRQYRCHAMLSQLSNSLFYGAQLIDAAAPEQVAPLVETVPTLALYDVCDGTEQQVAGGSFVNGAEATVVVALIARLEQLGVARNRIGVIALYKAQASYIAEKLSSADGAVEDDEAQVATVDAFQGAEKDVILLTTTRASLNIGFLDSPERLNVALTRARRHLLIVGHVRTLEVDAQWRFVVEQCRALGAVHNAHETVLKTNNIFI
jgi:hypothetical protein